MVYIGYQFTTLRWIDDFYKELEGACKKATDTFAQHWEHVRKYRGLFHNKKYVGVAMRQSEHLFHANFPTVAYMAGLRQEALLKAAKIEGTFKDFALTSIGDKIESPEDKKLCRILVEQMPSSSEKSQITNHKFMIKSWKGNIIT